MTHSYSSTEIAALNMKMTYLSAQTQNKTEQNRTIFQA